MSAVIEGKSQGLQREWLIGANLFGSRNPH